MWLHINNRASLINLNRYDTVEILQTPDKTFDLAAVRYEGQLRIATLIDKFDNEADAIRLQQEIVGRLAFTDHVLGIERDYLSQINNLGKAPKQN